MKRLLKRLLYAVAPKWTTAVMSARARAHSHRVTDSWGCPAVNDKLIAHFGSTVQEGPFAGLVLPAAARLEHLGPYLLGVYESELDQVWDVVLGGTYAQVIDIGAKFGYYAGGLARRYPGASVIAFDPDWWARAATKDLAQANKLGNIEVRPLCDATWLAGSLRPGALIISDCEGYESELFFGCAIPELASATLIIETHDCLVPGVCARLRTLFAATHTVHEVGTAATRRVSGRDLTFLSETERVLANQEVRSAQTWLLSLPKVGPNQGLHLGAAALRRAGS